MAFQLILNIILACLWMFLSHLLALQHLSLALSSGFSCYSLCDGS